MVAPRPRRVWTDRSRIEQAQRCMRSRWLGYHQDGTGIESLRKPLPLAVGGSVHVGLAWLLRGHTEDDAATAALADFATYASALEVDTTEAAGMAPQSTLAGTLASSLGLSPEDAGIESLVEQAAHARGDFDDYLAKEQSALVEGLVRAYARRRLGPLLEQFEVLEVEREGQWELWNDGDTSGWFMSRPDALLLERGSNLLYLLSYKTAASWDIRKARDAEHDMQGLSEGVEVERRLAAWWQEQAEYMAWTRSTSRMSMYLAQCPAPPRIHAVRYEYMLKGDRRRDKELSARLGIEARSQTSHLIRQYAAVSTPQRGAAPYTVGDVCWSWDYTRTEDSRDGSLAWQNWKPRAVWEQPGGVKAWIDKLGAAAPVMSGYDSTVGMAPRELGWQSEAQALGVTRQHPFDAVFLPPMTVYRNDDDLRDWIEQTEAQERSIAEGTAVVERAGDEDSRRSALNVWFPQTRRACEYPSTCAFVPVCYGGEDIRRDPLGSGRYRSRQANHPQELEGRNQR